MAKSTSSDSRVTQSDNETYRLKIKTFSLDRGGSEPGVHIAATATKLDARGFPINGSHVYIDVRPKGLYAQDLLDERAPITPAQDLLFLISDNDEVGIFSEVMLPLRDWTNLITNGTVDLYSKSESQRINLTEGCQVSSVALLTTESGYQHIKHYRQTLAGKPYSVFDKGGEKLNCGSAVQQALEYAVAHDPAAYQLASQRTIGERLFNTTFPWACYRRAETVSRFQQFGELPKPPVTVAKVCVATSHFAPGPLKTVFAGLSVLSRERQPLPRQLIKQPMKAKLPVPAAQLPFFRHVLPRSFSSPTASPRPGV